MRLKRILYIGITLYFAIGLELAQPNLNASGEFSGIIGDYVWYDENCDGIQSEGELGIPGVRVVLIADNGLFETYADITGYYFFDNLCPGNYEVDVDESTLPPTLMGPTAPNVGDDENDSDGPLDGGPVAVTLTEDKRQNLTIDFGYVLNGTIGGYVWFDLNGDGIQDSEDFGLDGIEITLYSLDGDEIETEITDDNGSYKFSNLCAGEYVVACKKIDDFVPTNSEKSPVKVTLTFDKPDNMSIDFGYYMYHKYLEEKS